MTVLLGRSSEEERISHLILNDGHRLLTLTGPGGVGKTRLAFDLAAMLEPEFSAGVAFITLSSVFLPNLVLPEIASRLEYTTDDAEDALAFVINAIGEHQMLIVLDNLEQVIDAAPAIGMLVEACPQLVVLTTSQAPLGIDGEQLFPLDPLPIPRSGEKSVAVLRENDAVQMFLQRARSANPDLPDTEDTIHVVAEICRSLEGMPLAIELAAARCNILPPQAILPRLERSLDMLGGTRRDVPPRLRSMRNAISWTYGLLNRREQRIFNYLSVFPGGFRIDALEFVCEALEVGHQALEFLDLLMSRSLIRLTPGSSADPRYLMLATLRQFGREQLDTDEETDRAEMTHASFLLRLVEQLEPHLIGIGQADACQRLRDETDSIRWAVQWARSSGNHEIILSLVASIWRFAENEGITSECLDWVTTALPNAADAQPALRARAWIAAASMHELHRELDVANTEFQTTLDLAREAGAQVTEASALIGLGTVALDRADYDTAGAYLNEALDIAQRTGNSRGQVVARSNLGSLAWYRSDFDNALSNFQAMAKSCERAGDLVGAAMSYCNCGAVANTTGDYTAAVSYLTRALTIERQLPPDFNLPITLMNLSESWMTLNDLTRALDLIIEAINISVRRKLPFFEATGRATLAEIMMRRGEPIAAAVEIEHCAELAESDAYHRILIEIGSILSEIHFSDRRYRTSAALHGAFARWRIDLESQAAAYREAIEANLLAKLREAAIDDPSIDTAFETGASWSIDEFRLQLGIHARQIIGERSSLPPPITSAVPPADYGLTPRERELLTMLCEGDTTQGIADALFLSPRTVTTHIGNILSKLSVTSRAAAVGLAIREGLV